MGALVGLGVGLGLLLIWSAFFVPRTPKEPKPGGGRGRQLLARAGFGDVSVASLTALASGAEPPDPRAPMKPERLAEMLAATPQGRPALAALARGTREG